MVPTHQVIATPSATQTSAASYTVEASGNPLVATIVTSDAAAIKSPEGPVVSGVLQVGKTAAATTTATAGETSAPPNVTAPSSEALTRPATTSVTMDVSAATVQAVQAAIEAARQQGALPYTMRLRNNPPKPA